ncbi:hypothetical protein Syun_017467 [Stephania yunnanensis]|uniref:Uncharacterized protein n=1 Tax=Stephania yunnanensis TaxID=152371 RepID=A0AAP0J8M2_9MAGN
MRVRVSSVFNAAGLIRDPFKREIGEREEKEVKRLKVLENRWRLRYLGCCKRSRLRDSEKEATGLKEKEKEKEKEFVSILCHTSALDLAKVLDQMTWRSVIDEDCCCDDAGVTKDRCMLRAHWWNSCHCAVLQRHVSTSDAWKRDGQMGM